MAPLSTSQGMPASRNAAAVPRMISTYFHLFSDSRPFVESIIVMYAARHEQYVRKRKKDAHCNMESECKWRAKTSARKTNAEDAERLDNQVRCRYRVKYAQIERTGARDQCLQQPARPLDTEPWRETESKCACDFTSRSGRCLLVAIQKPTARCETEIGEARKDGKENCERAQHDIQAPTGSIDLEKASSAQVNRMA